MLFLLPFVGQQLKSVPCRVRSRLPACRLWSEHPALNKLKSAPLHASVCADEGSKVRMLTRWKEKKKRKEKTPGLDDEIKWNFYCTGLARGGPVAECAA